MGKLILWIAGVTLSWSLPARAQAIGDAALGETQRALLAAHEHAPTDETRDALLDAAAFASESCAAASFDRLPLEGPCAAAVRLSEAAKGVNHPDVATTYRNLGVALHDAGAYAAAANVVRRALRIREAALGADHPAITKELDALGAILIDFGAFDEAERLLQRSLTIRKATLGHDHPDMATSLRLLSELAYGTGRYGISERLCRRAIAMREASPGTDDSELAASLHVLAVALHRGGQSKEAEQAARRAVTLQEAVAGPEDPTLATYLGSLASLLLQVGRLEEAERLLRRALAIDDAVLGPTHPRVAQLLSILARWHYARSEYAEAEALERRALAISEAVFGEHELVATNLGNLAHCLDAQGKHREAESVARRALAVAEGALGEAHPLSRHYLRELAVRLADTGQLAASEPFLRRALKLDQAAEGPYGLELASSLLRLGHVENRKGAYAEAESLYRRALAVREATLGPKHPDVAIAASYLASLLGHLGEYAEAVQLLRRAVTIGEAALGHEHQSVGAFLRDLATLLEKTEAYAEAEEVARRAVAIEEKALGPNHIRLVYSLSTLGTVLSARGGSEEAESHLVRALTIWDSHRRADPATLATLLNNLASVLLEMGAFAEAEPLLRRALASQETLGEDHPQSAVYMGNLAFVLRQLGAYAEAESLLRRAVAVHEAAFGSSHPGTLNLMSHLGSLLSRMDAFEEAEVWFRRAFAALEDSGTTDSVTAAEVLTGLAEVFAQSGRLSEAVTLRRRALAIEEARLGPNHPVVARTLVNLANVLDDDAEAERAYRRALGIVEASQGPEHPGISTALWGLANQARRNGDLRATERMYERLVRVSEGTHGPWHPDTARFLAHLAQIQRHAGDALELLERALEAEEAHLSVNLHASSPHIRRLRLADFSSTASQVVSLHLHELPTSERAAELALETVLRRKGRLADLEHDTLNRIRKAADDEELALLRQLERATARLSVIHESVPNEPDALRSWQTSRTALTEEVTRLQRTLAERSAVYARAVRPVTVADVAAKLPPKTALLEFVVYVPDVTNRDTGRRYAVYMLRPDGRIRPLDLGPASEIEARVRTFRNAVEARAPLARDAARLFAATLEPIADELETLETLYVAGDGLLHLVPFEALLGAPPGGEARRSRRRYRAGPSIRYLSSGRDLLRTPSQPSNGASLVVFDVNYDERPETPSSTSEATGPWLPLPGTRAEGLAVVESLRDARSLSGARATESSLRAVERPHVLHIASHGYFDPGSPTPVALGTRSDFVRPLPRGAGPSRLDTAPLLRSAVVLAGANRAPAGDDNGLLTAAELANVDLRGTVLAVLSACETGTGEIRNGDGVLGMRRALVLAGARAQVVSLWKVDDVATSALMAAFYRQLARGRPIAVALERAQKRIRRQTDWSHPFYWAAFTVSGDADARL